MNPNLNPNFASIGQEFVQAYFDMYRANAQRKNIITLMEKDTATTLNGKRMSPQDFNAAIGALSDMTNVHVVSCESQPSTNMGVIVLTTGKAQFAMEGLFSFVIMFHMCFNTSTQRYWLSNTTQHWAQ